MPDRDRMLGYMPDSMPDRLPEYISNRMPESMPIERQERERDVYIYIYYIIIYIYASYRMSVGGDRSKTVDASMLQRRGLAHVAVLWLPDPCHLKSNCASHAHT